MFRFRTHSQVLVGYFALVLLVGLFSRGWMSSLRRRAALHAKFRVRFMLLCAVVLLWMASALPLVVWMLGLTVFDLFEFAPTLALFLTPRAVHAYALAYALQVRILECRFQEFLIECQFLFQFELIFVVDSMFVFPNEPRSCLPCSALRPPSCLSLRACTACLNSSALFDCSHF